MSRRCSFALDRDAWRETRDRRFPLSEEELEDGRWRCPRVAADDGEHCIFHQRPADRSASPDEFATAFAAAINDEPDPEAFAVSAGRKALQRAAKQFVGARIGTLRLSYERLEASDTYPIDLRGATAEVLEWNWTQFGERVLLDGAAVGSIALDHVRADADVLLRDVEIGTLRMKEATVNGDVVCKRAAVEGGFSLSDSEVRGAIELKESECESKVSLNRVDAADVTIRNTGIGTDLSIRHASLEGDLECSRSPVGRRLDCNGIDVGGDLTWNGGDAGATASFENAAVAGRIECAIRPSAVG